MVEAKIDIGPGYRLYYTQRRFDLILLLSVAKRARSNETSTWHCDWQGRSGHDARDHPLGRPGVSSNTGSCAAYVQAAIDEAGDDAAFVVKALGEVARSRGMASIARELGVTREGLYKSISENGNPSFATVFRLMHLLGLEVKVSAATT